MVLAALTPQFLAQNLHFAVYLLAAAACFMTGWLYFDGRDNHHPWLKAAKYSGFFLVALGFLLAGTSGAATGTWALVGGGLKLLGYLGIIISGAGDPIQPKPHTVGLQFDDFNDASAAPLGAPGTQRTPAVFGVMGTAAGLWLLPAASLVIFIQYLRRTTTGLERHLKGITIAFGIFVLGDLSALADLWQTGRNPLLQQFTQGLGPVWCLHHLLIAAGGAVLLRWVWRYLTKQPQTQLFVLATTAMIAVVLVTTVTITTQSLLNQENNTLADLETSAKVMTYTIDSKLAATRADATIAARTPVVVSALAASDHGPLAKLSADGTSSLLLADAGGQVQLRSNDPELYGDSVSNNSMVKRALAGSAVSALATQTNGINRDLIASTTVPVVSGQKTVGVAMASRVLDTNFVDGIKRTTGLDSTIYSGATRTATTLVAPDGVTRFTGAKETAGGVLTTTLTGGKVWRGSLNLSNRPFLAVYLPLKDADGNVIGMLSVAQSQTVLLEAAKNAINATYLLAALWLVVSVVPIYLVTRQITRQLL